MDLVERVMGTAAPALTVGVSRGGERSVVAGGREAVDERARWRIMSLTKVFTAVAVVLATGERGIPLATPAIELLPSLAPDWRADRSITVEQLLVQVAGLRDSVTGADVAGLSLDDAARLAVRAGSAHEPGARWEYYNGNYFIAGALLAALTGTGYEDAIERRVLKPWGLGSTGFENPADPVRGWDDGAAATVEYPRSRRPSGGLWSCAGDLLAFGERLLGSAPLLETVRGTAPHGLGWAHGPSGQLYLNGRLPGYRAAYLLLPSHGYASVALANTSGALPEIAGLLSDLQRPLTGDDIAADIDAYAA